MFTALIEELMGWPIGELNHALARATAKRDEADLEIAAVTAVTAVTAVVELRVHLIKPDGTVIKPLNTRDPDWADTGVGILRPGDEAAEVLQLATSGPRADIGSRR